MSGLPGFFDEFERLLRENEILRLRAEASCPKRSRSRIA
jgi:hypothetical protein